MKKAITYIRVSTKMQDVARQRMKIQEYCDRNNYEIVQEIVDYGISGARADQEGYIKLQSLTDKDGEILVISELSRLSREETLITVNTIQNIIYHGLDVVFLDDASKYYKANQALNLIELITLLVSADKNAKERIEIKRKNQEGKQAILSNNPYAMVDGNIPFGFQAIYNPNGRRPKKILEENEQEVEHIKKVYELILSGYSLGEVARYFNNRNITFRGFFVTRQLLGRLIKHSIYKGVRERKLKFDREEASIISVNIKPIITPEDFDRANLLVKENHKYKSTGKNLYNPLKGIFKCRCGRSMIVKDKKPEKAVTKLTYRCSYVGTEDNPIACHFKDEISYHLTNEIIYSLFKYMNYSENIDFFKGQIDNKVQNLIEEIDGLNKQIKNKELIRSNLEAENQELVQSYLEARSSTLRTAVQNKQIEIENKIEALKKEMNKLTDAKLSKEADKLRLIDTRKKEKLDNLNIQEKGELFHKHLASVTYYTVTMMQGFYVIQFRSGLEFIIAVRKTARSPLVSILPDKYTLNKDTLLITEYKETSKNTSLKNFSLNTTVTTKEITIQEYLKSEIAELRSLRIDYSYRKQYNENLKMKREE
ncbi:recombinase family protein [Butyricimonas synergistica]|uniref:recombinase family protein n=1 Tax=Butyricimonas synergistica TaxID=544644 RepID=UPI0003A19C46|nr:recombinase family protein [Butyricimonas synergistica]